MLEEAADDTGLTVPQVVVSYEDWLSIEWLYYLFNNDNNSKCSRSNSQYYIN